ncbi:hypothetical protein Rsub_01889 [Raphidocelis subcapitata]|uniref:Uncharacterized protein n=1 Tax=Raphidocelis subcapitata TaxID=307507 RepID=A0A2V0NRA5_9CHLO|nr:hypothetical protein Rsub_01889 [Raphidocelis subcapitata]|eukprot:GBF89172.1 hypothetical protein Rsub_01889 [Raphidocelis subcapitata]
MPPAQSPAATRRLWTFITGLLWGLFGGAGLSGWLLVKVLHFQRSELERRHAWVRLRSKASESAGAPPRPVTRWEDLDADSRELLRAVDEALVARGQRRMDEHELATAAAAVVARDEHGRDHDSGPRLAIMRAVTEVVERRRGAAAS